MHSKKNEMTLKINKFIPGDRFAILHPANAPRKGAPGPGVQQISYLHQEPLSTRNYASNKQLSVETHGHHRQNSASASIQVHLGPNEIGKLPDATKKVYYESKLLHKQIVQLKEENLKLKEEIDRLKDKNTYIKDKYKELVQKYINKKKILESRDSFLESQNDEEDECRELQAQIKKIDSIEQIQEEKGNSFDHNILGSDSLLSGFIIPTTSRLFPLSTPPSPRAERFSMNFIRQVRDVQATKDKARLEEEVEQLRRSLSQEQSKSLQSINKNRQRIQQLEQKNSTLEKIIKDLQSSLMYEKRKIHLINQITDSSATESLIGNIQMQIQKGIAKEEIKSQWQ